MRKNCAMTNTGDCPPYTTLESEIGIFDNRNRRQRRADARAKRKLTYKRK